MAVTGTAGGPRRAATAANLVVFLVAVATLAVAINVIAAHPSMRARIDATRTRAYSLSEQTRRLLADLDGDWSIAVVMSPDQVDQAVARQVEEVLARYDDASPRIDVVAIDPGDPVSLDTYEALLSRLRGIYAGRIDQYDDALAEALDALDGYHVFLQQQAGRLASLRRGAAAGEAAGELDQLVAVVALRLEQVAQVEAEVRKARRVTDSRPLPDYETARSVLAAALSGWAGELYQIAQLLTAWREDESADMAVRQFASDDRHEYEHWAQELALAGDPLKYLEPLELARVGRSLEAGETAIVIGPPGAAVIPPAQLFPSVGLRQRDGGDVAFDRRFRGEQAISAAIRSLRMGAMPHVVLVHAQGESMLSPRAQNVDFAGAAQTLVASRIEVSEWIVGRDERPDLEPGTRTVWVVLPPPIPQRRSLHVTEDELALIETARRLVDEGEAVLLNFAPSAQARTGRSDPWRELAGPLGLDVDTSRVVYEHVRGREGEISTQRVAQLVALEPGHPVAAAAHGLQVAFDLPLAVRPAEARPEDLRQMVIAQLEPGSDRWLERDWTVNPERIEAPPATERLDKAAPLVVAVERVAPSGAAAQRVLVVGSGGWLLTYLADVVVPAGGQRMVLLNPGNYELLLASVAWLAGADEMIAPSPVSRQVARLEGLTGGARALWRWIALAVLPAACLALGVVVWTVRR